MDYMVYNELKSKFHSDFFCFYLIIVNFIIRPFNGNELCIQSISSIVVGKANSVILSGEFR